MNFTDVRASEKPVSLESAPLKTCLQRIASPGHDDRRVLLFTTPPKVPRDSPARRHDRYKHLSCELTRPGGSHLVQARTHRCIETAMVP